MGSHEPAGTYWNRAAGRVWALLAVWLFLSFMILVAAPDARGSNLLGVPTAIWLVAQGCALALVATILLRRRGPRPDA